VLAIVEKNKASDPFIVVGRRSYQEPVGRDAAVVATARQLQLPMAATFILVLVVAVAATASAQPSRLLLRSNTLPSTFVYAIYQGYCIDESGQQVKNRDCDKVRRGCCCMLHAPHVTGTHAPMHPCIHAGGRVVGP